MLLLSPGSCAIVYSAAMMCHTLISTNSYSATETRVSSETSFVSKQPKLEPKLVSALSETRRLFCCFALISKQGVLVFRNNRNEQKTNRNSSKFVKISTFLIHHTIISVYFGCFGTSPKHRNKPKKMFFGFVKKQTEKQLKQIEFRFVSVLQTEKQN